ncbi:MAG: RNA-binding cell elongation regulator Jag/EloR [Anaerolineae bacterium]|nr:Jag N-terminal domain-containing protein [Candidatus Roseilinea sp.]MDW8449783.1 RNA-binding cell elongation regulator Jag/EloR [Anaerolineae bacterium]
MPAIEVSAPDVESAIAQGLQQLNLIRAEVKIEVLDEGSRGVLGIGAKPARVRLTPFAELEAQQAAPAPAAAPPPPASAAIQGSPPPIAEASPPVVQKSVELPAGAPASNEAPEDAPAPKIEGEELALTLVRDILRRMGIKRYEVKVKSIFPANSEEEPSIWVDVTLVNAFDEELMLSHQREGLNALQTVVQTMWSHRTRSSLRVNVDVNGYRRRREQQLINMARRLADKVVANGKPITLEPMPANERRIVHMALRDRPGVFTESCGEGASRKVQIKPKK